MKNLKKVLSVLLVVAMLAATMVPAFAAETATISADAKITADIGMLVGDGNGVTADYTKTAPTRIQAAILLLRLKGLEADAAKFAGKDNFADVKGDEWFAPYTAYLKANSSVGFVGVEDGKFAADLEITATEYYKVVLTALGYECGDGKDYVYADTIKFAAEKGLKLVADVTAYTINDLAIATVEALKTAVKGGTKTLATTLVEANKMDAAKAADAGIYTKPATGVAATIVGKAKFNVAFGTAVDTSKAVITVKKGTIAYNTKAFTWAEDKKSVVVEMASALTKGDYEITVAGLSDTALTAKVTAEDEKVTKIEFTSENALISRTSNRDVTVGYKVLNQYNEAVTTSYQVTATSSYGTQTPQSGTFTITGSADFTIGSKIAVSLLHVDSGSFVSAVLTVADKAQVADVAIKALVLKDSKELDTSKAAADYKLEVEFKDQFGNVMKTPADVHKDIIVTVSDPSKVTIKDGTATAGTVTTTDTTFNYTDSKMYLPLAAAPSLAAGTSKVTFISKTTGKLASFDIVVKETAKVDVLTLSAPELAVAGEKVKIPFTAVDQFGNAITSESILTAGMTSLSASDSLDIKFVQDYVNNKADLVLDLAKVAAAKTVVITGITKTNKLVSLTVSVVAPRKPLVVSSYTSAFTPNLAVGAKSDLRNDRVVVKDQYGRDITTIRNSANDADISIYTANNYRISAVSGSPAYVILSGSETVTANTYYIASTARDGVGPITFTGKAKGSSTITLKLQKYNTTTGLWDNITGSEYVFTAKTVEKADIVSYELAAIATLYDDVANGGDKVADDSAYKKAVTVNGILADGTKVVVPSSYYTVTTGLNKSVQGYVYASNTAFTGTATETTVPVVVTVAGATGPSILNQNVTVSKVAPVVTTLTVVTSTVGNAKPEGNNVISTAVANADTKAKIDALAISAIKCVDQYGVENTNDTYSTIVTNLTSGKTIDGVDNATVTNVAAGNTFNVTAVSSNGIAITFKVILN